MRDLLDTVLAGSENVKKLRNKSEQTDLQPVSSVRIFFNRYFNPCNVGGVACVLTPQGMRTDLKCVWF